MAVEADKKPPENKSYTERIVDFSGGLNTTISGSLLNSNEAKVAKNISMEQKGTIKPRRGRKKRYPTAFSSDPVTGLGVYYKNDGTSRIITSSGSVVYTDAPHMATKWDAKADWEATGTSLAGYGTVTQFEGSVAARAQALGEAAKCADATLWTATDSMISMKANDSPYPDGDCLEVMIAAGKTEGFATVPVAADVDRTKYHAIVAYLKSYTGSSGSIKLVGRTAGGTTSKAGSNVTATTWTKTVLKCTPAEMLNISSIGVSVANTAGQYAYFTGLFYIPITEAEYNNAGYVAPELTYYEPFQKVDKYETTDDYASGTHTNSSVSTLNSPTTGTLTFTGVVNNPATSGIATTTVTIPYSEEILASFSRLTVVSATVNMTITGDVDNTNEGVVPSIDDVIFTASNGIFGYGGTAACSRASPYPLIGDLDVTDKLVNKTSFVLKTENTTYTSGSVLTCNFTLKYSFDPYPYALSLDIETPSYEVRYESLPHFNAGTHNNTKVKSVIGIRVTLDRQS